MQHHRAERRLGGGGTGRLLADVAHVLGQEIFAVAHRLDEHEHEIEEKREGADEHELGRRILGTEFRQRIVRHHQRQHRERRKHAQRRGGALDPEPLFAVARAADQQTQADDAVEHDRDRGEHRVAGERVLGRAARQHGGDDQRGLDHRNGERQQHRAERLADLQRDHFGMMDRGEHRAEQQHGGKAGDPQGFGMEKAGVLEPEQDERGERRRVGSRDRAEGSGGGGHAGVSSARAFAP